MLLALRYAKSHSNRRTLTLQYWELSEKIAQEFDEKFCATRRVNTQKGRFKGIYIRGMAEKWSAMCHKF